MRELKDSGPMGSHIIHQRGLMTMTTDSKAKTLRTALLLLACPALLFSMTACGEQVVPADPASVKQTPTDTNDDQSDDDDIDDSNDG
ncbi:hypothetical protein [Bifidobacterium callitrichos]|nr:hypothetical protein [Bifidobacterium callitrichos]